jgi:CelD/BcsL family acetyltransferase involved in cellulose biosynthesis
MMSGDKVVAWNYGFDFHGTWFWYQPTFDTEFERYSPGFCLLSMLIEEAAENHALSVVDLGLGAGEYKERFANQSCKTLGVTLRSAMAKHLQEILRYRTAELIKTSPRLEASVRRFYSRLRKNTKSDPR